MRRLAIVALAACGGGGAQVDAPPVDSAPRSQTLTGTIRYEDKKPAISGLHGVLGPIMPVPARGVSILVFDDTTSMSTILAMGVTADDGTYSVTFTASDDAMIHVTASAFSNAPLRPISVIHSGGTLVHAFGGPSFVVSEAAGDVLVTAASNEAEAFNIFDQMVSGFDKLHAIYNDPAPQPLRVQWTKGNTDGTYFDGQSIHLLGQTSDDDGYDDTVMLHEMGHYVAANQGRDDSPGGAHDGSAADPRLAWSEGWATYWEMAVFDAPIYIDTNMEGGFNENADTEVLTATLAGPLTQKISEDMVTEILWDLGDGGAGDDDLYSGTHEAVMQVQTYLKTATLRNVGTVGVDLVDFLDGWFLTAGLTACTAVKSIVMTTHQFPYDFNGPVGACP